jgi:ABC-type bacteriocin/lantibiotic exporter with double-glycine peptidase domain
MFRHIRQALTLLSGRERKQVYLLLALSAMAAIVQTVAILSIMPFIVLLANPAILQTNELLRSLYEILGVQTYHEFLIFFGVFGILILTIGNLFLAFEHWLSQRFLYLLGHRVEKLVLQRLLQQPYEYFMARHTGHLGDIVLRQVERVVDGVIGTFISVFSNFALAVFVVLMLLIVSLKTTLVTLSGLLMLYLAVFLILRRRIASHGAELTQLSGNVFAIVKETFDGIQEIKTRRAEGFFARRFEESSLKLSWLAIRYGLMSFLPNFFLETLVFSGLVAVALYFIITTQSSGVSLSFIALYGMAAYRLVPSLKGVFEGISDIHHNGDAVRIVLEHCQKQPEQIETIGLAAPTREIQFQNVSYRYGNSGDLQLNDIDLSVQIGSSVCLFGPSGAGKTTLLNLLVGLIYPKQGNVLCDDTAIAPETVDSWRENIGYCPQQIFLFNDTISSNVAFGVPGDEIDQARVVEAGKLAILDEFVSQGLERGYESIIGEDGKTLSGGQRQRIGIARALYHDPDIIILDESFAGLDSANKTAVLDNLFTLTGKTLIFSSHDAAIASRCDKVVLMEQGRLIAQGSYHELLSESPQFVKLLSRLDDQQRT